MLLLSGDAIVNESMLTGERVPVSKAPVKDEDILKGRNDKTENPKTFLYCGTRVVRIRGTFTPDGQGRPALAVVARTGIVDSFIPSLLVSYFHAGFNTTKGALIRSMLYPKPIGFKFYRDSVRFIMVLAGIAGLGFCFSAIEFIRMGVSDDVHLIGMPLLTRATVEMADYCCPSIRSHHCCCTARPSSHFIYRYQLFHRTFKETRYFLHIA